MKRVEAFLETSAHDIARKSERFGARVEINASVLDRSDSITLSAPGLVSANGSCRMIRTADGWVAINLPRLDDIASVPALLKCTPEQNVWGMVLDKAVHKKSAELVERAELLGLAVAEIGETPIPSAPCRVQTHAKSAAQRKTLRVVDFSSLWAGPLCGAVFATMGADVLKIESAERPDTTAESAPLLDQRLNGAKRKKRIPLSNADGLAAFHDEIAQSDILITSARARALEGFELRQERLFAANPSLIWIAITGHGFDNARVAFGDDAAASGGLVAWEGDEPRFLGDALADPLTGIAAASAALDALEHGGGAFIDAALAKTAANVAVLNA